MTIRNFLETTTFEVDDFVITIFKNEKRFWFFSKDEIPPEFLGCQIVKTTMNIEKDFDTDGFINIHITCTLYLEFVVE